MIRFVWRSGPVTETPIWLPVNDGGLGGFRSSRWGEGRFLGRFPRVGTLGYHSLPLWGRVWLSVSLSQTAGPLALAVPIAQLTSPLGWARQIAGPLALRIGRSIISAFDNAGTYGGVGDVGRTDRTIDFWRGFALSAPADEASGAINRARMRSAVR